MTRDFLRMCSNVSNNKLCPQDQWFKDWEVTCAPKYSGLEKYFEYVGDLFLYYLGCKVHFINKERLVEVIDQEVLKEEFKLTDLGGLYRWV